MSNAPSKVILLLLSITTTSIAIAAAPAKNAAHKTAPTGQKSAQPGTKDTRQMAGGNGVFGETYPVTDTNQFGPVNFTLFSAEYGVDRFNLTSDTAYAPRAGEKLLILHYRLKNPNAADLYSSSRSLFQTVTFDEQTREVSGQSRWEGQKEIIAAEIKPGQGFDDLVTYAVIPAKGALPKLILRMGRAGTSDKVIRYLLGQGKNRVKPLPVPYADPVDPSGATALVEVPAKIGATYITGDLDVSLDSVAFADSPLGELTTDEGKRFLVATITVTNKTWEKVYFSTGFTAALMTSNDDRVTDSIQWKDKRNEAWEGKQLESEETATVRLILSVPKNATGKTLKLSENINHSGDISQTLLYDILGAK
jgi:hypothetical protein